MKKMKRIQSTSRTHLKKRKGYFYVNEPWGCSTFPVISSSILPIIIIIITIISSYSQPIFFLSSGVNELAIRESPRGNPLTSTLVFFSIVFAPAAK